jgi:hypothetical protein
MADMKDDSYTEKETQRRMDEALKRALNTPHKPHKPKGSGSKAASKHRRKKGS